MVDLYPTNSLTHICNQKSSENSPEVVPTRTKYITASGKQVLTLLKSAAAVIPVPMLQEAIGVAVKIIEVCQVRKTLPRKSCDIVHDLILGHIFCRTESQRVARQGMPFDDRYRGQRHRQDRRRWR